MKTKTGIFIASLVTLMFLAAADKPVYSWGKSKQAKQPSLEIIAATKEALSKRIFEGDNEPAEEETRFKIIYIFNSNAENCEVCTEDIRKMFETVFFETEYAYSGPVSLLMATEADSDTTLEYLAKILAPVFSKNYADPQKIELYLGALHFLINCRADFTDLGLKTARLPV
ncbi:MAG: hypothetical protein NTX00_04210, partial [Candidatus Parcubacteria bacterium]|nr:hypothetical protein [Candidatus Parcubacteria bacterium]